MRALVISVKPFFISFKLDTKVFKLLIVSWVIWYCGFVSSSVASKLFRLVISVFRAAIDSSMLLVVIPKFVKLALIVAKLELRLASLLSSSVNTWVLL